MLYSRGVDRKDPELLRDLYTKDATDTHGDTFDGPADSYVDFLKTAFPFMRYSGHHISNHLISVNGDDGDGEVYAIAWHLIPDGNRGWMGILGSGFDLSLFGTNVLEKEYITFVNGGYYAYGFEAVQMGMPRQFGARLRYSF